MWTISKVCIKFVTIFLLFCVLVFWPWGMCDLSSPTVGQTWPPCTRRWSLNHWTAREVSNKFFSACYGIVIYGWNIACKQTSRTNSFAWLTFYTCLLAISHFSLFSAPGNHHSSLWFYELDSFRFHVSGISQCVPVCDWLISLSIMCPLHCHTWQGFLI